MSTKKFKFKFKSAKFTLKNIIYFEIILSIIKLFLQALN